MNSALQCLSSAAPIVDFLVSGTYQQDVNLDNPLGSKGAMAEAYAGVVGELWSSRTAVVDVRPRSSSIFHSGISVVII